jgi:hypothetical protein
MPNLKHLCLFFDCMHRTLVSTHVSQIELQVAALATLAILRVLSSASTSKEANRLQVKCITFSQPPVGNAALRE